MEWKFLINQSRCITVRRQVAIILFVDWNGNGFLEKINKITNCSPIKAPKTNLSIDINFVILIG